MKITMATRRSPRILTTTIEICPDSDSEEQQENHKPIKNVLEVGTPSVKKETRKSSRMAVMKQLSQTAPRRAKRQTGLKQRGGKNLESADLWTRAMNDDDALAHYIKERERLDQMIDKTELSIIGDKNVERLNTTI